MSGLGNARVVQLAGEKKLISSVSSPYRIRRGERKLEWFQSNSSLGRNFHHHPAGVFYPILRRDVQLWECSRDTGKIEDEDVYTTETNDTVSELPHGDHHGNICIL